MFGPFFARFDGDWTWVGTWKAENSWGTKVWALIFLRDLVNFSQKKNRKYNILVLSWICIEKIFSTMKNIFQKFQLKSSPSPNKLSRTPFQIFPPPPLRFELAKNLFSFPCCMHIACRKLLKLHWIIWSRTNACYTIFKLFFLLYHNRHFYRIFSCVCVCMEKIFSVKKC